MKRTLLVSLLMFFSMILLAQDSDSEIKTLFKKKESGEKIKLGWYIGPQAMYTQFKQKDVFLAGLNFGVTLNHFFSVGLTASGIVNPGNLWYDNIDSYHGAYLAGGYGGVKFEFAVFPRYPVHISFPVTIGGGGLTYLYNNYYEWDTYYNYTSLDWDAFFLVEPGINVEVNVVKFFRIFAGASYRYTPDLDLMNTPTDLINNFNAVLGLKFGKF